MVITLFGSDSYRRAAKARELVAAYRAKYPLADLLTVDLEETPEDWTKARDFLRQPSMFVDSKVLVVREPSFIETPTDKLAREWSEALKEAIRANGIVVILSSADDPAEAFPFLAGKGVERQEFRELEARLLEVFVLREAKARAVAFEPAALRLFLAYLEAFPARSARAVSELDRFALARFPAPVARADAERALAWTPVEELYRGARSLMAGRDPLERLVALERLLLSGEAGAKLFNTLGYLAEGAPAAVLAEYDIAVKGGKLDYEETLTDFAIGNDGRWVSE